MLRHRALPFKTAEGTEMSSDALTTRRSDGILKLEEAELLFEFQITDEVMTGSGIEKDTEEVTEVRVPLPSVVSVGLQARWWRRRLRIGTDSLRTFDGVPGAKQGQIDLRIARKDMAAARELAAEIEMRLADLALRKIEASALSEAIDRLAPPSDRLGPPSDRPGGDES